MKTKATIPIVDLGKVKPTDNYAECPEWKDAAEKIRDGLGTVGFLYLVNHGIPDSMIAEAFDQTKRFFAQNEQQKMRYKKDTGDKSAVFDIEKYPGYTPMGEEKLDLKGKLEVKEALEWTDRPKSNFPSEEELPGFKTTIDRLDDHAKNLFRTMLRLMAMSLKLEDTEFFINKCLHLDEPVKNPGIYVGRILHYPAITEEDERINDDAATRCGEHTDYVFLTLLLQDSVGGLEIKTVDGTWISAEPVPGSVIVNTGDLTEFWTSGIFPATPHRVIIPAEKDSEMRNKSRYSIGNFCGADNDVMIVPMDLEKRPAELKRMQEGGKVYEKEPISAYEHVMRRCANHTYNYS